MSVGIGTQAKRREGDRRSVGSVLRAVGRVALWALVGLLLLRGISGVLTEPRPADRGAAAHGSVSDPATAAFAVRFARTYLSEPSPQALAPFLAPGVSTPAPVGTGNGAKVEQAEVAGIRDLGGGQAIVTVACELGDARTLYLAVPIVREGAAEVAAQGVPAVVAGPAGVGGSVEAPSALAGSEAGAINELVRRFLPAYFSATTPGDLAYLLTPGATVTPPGGGFELLAVASVKQIGGGEGARRTAIATAQVRDAASGAVYPLAYRLQLLRRDRWYVEAVEGALS
ncbi:MAG TPA: conjugal transfer protein [Solirubrobacterales bacterium]|nr:conjugal transfer protein [Solirubrobacterales bacterium]